MKIKDDLVLRDIAGEHIIMAVGKTAVNFDKFITLNDTGAFLYKLIKDGTEETKLVDAVLKEYDVELQKAEEDVSEFVSSLKKVGIIE
ncbi:MAG: PqqD family protein [Bacillota bacterium]|nr:PqqD family protein [Bacillota bacterium]